MTPAWKNPLNPFKTMEITNIESFISYYGKTREVTQKVLEVIPPGQLNWTYMAGKFTIADLVRHIAAIERYVFAEIAAGNRPGPGRGI